MHLDNFIQQLDKLGEANEGFDYSLGKSLNQNDITAVQNNLCIQLPEKTKDFIYQTNGLLTSNPNFELIELDAWKIDDGLIHFATFDNSIKVYFDTRKLNQANEWSIINKDNDYILTYSIASFYSNKIWHWLKHRHKIWVDNWWTR